MRPVGEHMNGGVCVCERGHPPTALLARPPCPEDCIWPSGGYNPRTSRTWNRSTIRGENGPRTSGSIGTWPGPGRHVSPARLPGGQISLSFFMVAQLCPMGGLFYTLRGPAFWGDFYTSCGSAGSRLGGKLQIKCGLSQRLGCSLCACSLSVAGHLLAPTLNQALGRQRPASCPLED